MIAAFAGLLAACAVCLFMILLALKVNGMTESNGYRSMLRYGAETQALQDKQDLHRFGLQQSLRRVQSGWQASRWSFGTMALIGSAALFAGPAIEYGGWSVIGWGLPVLALFYVCVSGALAEIASALPTMGSLAHASVITGGAGWGRLAGWLHLIGHLAMLALILGGCARLVDSVAADILRYTPSTMSFWLVAAAIAGTQAGISQWFPAWREKFRGAGLWALIAIACVILGAGLLLLWRGAYAVPLLYPFKDLNLESPAAPASYAIGLLLLLKLFLGMDGAAAAAEETVEPRIRIPWSIFLSTAYTFIFALLLLTSAALALIAMYSGAGMEGLFAQPGAFLLAMFANWGNTLPVAALIAVSLWISGYQSLAVCSRILFSLARDQAVPFSEKIARVTPSNRLSASGIWSVAVGACALMILAQIGGSGKELYFLLTLCIIGLHAAYALPIGLRLLGRIKERGSRKGRIAAAPYSIWRAAPWQLGKWSFSVNAVAFVWLVVSGIGAAWLLEPSAAIVMTAILLLLASWRGFAAARNKRGTKGLAQAGSYGNGDR